MLAGMKSEQVAGFVSESMAGFSGIRILEAEMTLFGCCGEFADDFCCHGMSHENAVFGQHAFMVLSV